MYNNIGILTPRGTGTSGHVQANKFNLKRAPVPRFNEGQAAPAAADKKPNQDILEHNRKRQIEIKLLEIQDELEESGLSAEEVDKALAEKRTELLAEYEREKESQSDANLSNETHAVALRKQEQMEKMRKAFGLGEVVWGEAFDPEIQAKKKQERIDAQRQAEKEAFEKREALRKEKEERAKRKEQERQERAAAAEAAAAEAQQRRRDKPNHYDGYNGAPPDRRGYWDPRGHGPSGKDRQGWHRQLPHGEGYYRHGDVAPDRYNPELDETNEDVLVYNPTSRGHEKAGREPERGRNSKPPGTEKREQQRKRKPAASSSSSSATSSGSSSSSGSDSSSSSGSGSSSSTTSSSSSSGSEDSADSGRRGKRQQASKQQVQPGSQKRGREPEPQLGATTAAAPHTRDYSPKRARRGDYELRAADTAAAAGRREGRSPLRVRERDQQPGGRDSRDDRDTYRSGSRQGPAAHRSGRYELSEHAASDRLDSGVRDRGRPDREERDYREGGGRQKASARGRERSGRDGSRAMRSKDRQERESSRDRERSLDRGRNAAHDRQHGTSDRYGHGRGDGRDSGRPRRASPSRSNSSRSVSSGSGSESSGSSGGHHRSRRDRR